MVGSVDKMVAEAEAAKALAAAKGKGGKGEGEDPATLRASGGGLFDVILIGGGVGVDAAGVAQDEKGPRGERVPGGEGRTPAERLDLVLDR